MNRIGSGGRHDRDLRSLAFAIAGRVGIGHDVELAHRIHAQQLAARAARSDIDQRSARVLHSVEQVEIVLGPASGDRKHTADRRVRRSDRTAALGRVVHRGGVQRNQLIVGAAVQRQVFHLALVDQAGGLLGRHIHGAWRVRYGDLLGHRSRMKRDHDAARLSDGERNIRARLRGEGVARHRNRVAANRNRRRCVRSGGIGHQAALATGLLVVNQHRGTGNHSACGILHSAADRAANHLRVQHHRSNQQ